MEAETMTTVENVGMLVAAGAGLAFWVCLFVLITSKRSIEEVRDRGAEHARDTARLRDEVRQFSSDFTRMRIQENAFSAKANPKPSPSDAFWAKSERDAYGGGEPL